MSWGSPGEGPNPVPTVAGRRLADRYELIAPIASGGMARVWSARDVQLDRDVAIKILHPHLLTDDGFVARFRREAVASARLQHRSIVSVYDTISGDGLEAIVMELIDGQTMRALLDTAGALPARDVVAIGRQIAEALAVAHATGLVHRDIKPANIMVRDDGRVLVTDFGIAKAANDADLTSTGTLLGTAKYLSPEQVTGGPIDPRSDLYALGVVLFEALAGTVPFKANTDAATALARIREEPPPLGRLRPNVPGDLEAVIMRLMARELDDRYAAAGEVAQALAAVDLNSAPRGEQGPPAATPAQVAAGLRPPDPPPSTLPYNGLRPPDPPRTPVVYGGTGNGVAPSFDPGATADRPAGGPGNTAHRPAFDPGATADRPSGGPGITAGPAPSWPAPSPVPDPGRDPSIELLGTTGGMPIHHADPHRTSRPDVGPGPGGGHPATSSERVRGTRWLPVAVVVLVVAAVATFGLYLSRLGSGTGADDRNPLVEGGPGLPVASATSFDPLSADDVKLEREELVPFAFDGDPATAWTSEPYRRRALGGLKAGVGLQLTLEESLPLNQIELVTRSEGWQLDVYVGEEFGPDPAAWGAPAASIDAGSNRQVRDLGRVEGAVVLLWIRDTGQSEAGRFQFVLGEVIIR